MMVDLLYDLSSGAATDLQLLLCTEQSLGLSLALLRTAVVNCSREKRSSVSKNRGLQTVSGFLLRATMKIFSSHDKLNKIGLQLDLPPSPSLCSALSGSATKGRHEVSLFEPAISVEGVNGTLDIADTMKWTS
jgi:hypothetical protein